MPTIITFFITLPINERPQARREENQQKPNKVASKRLTMGPSARQALHPSLRQGLTLPEPKGHQLTGDKDHGIVAQKMKEHRHSHSFLFYLYLMVLITSQSHQNYYQSGRIMNHFERIFQQKLAPSKLDPKLPVSCSLFDIYQTQKDLLQSSKSRKETIQAKNRRIAEENLKYREQLNQRLTLLQHKHDKNRRDSLTKVIKSEQRKREYRKEILSKHKQAQKEALRQRLAMFRQHAQHMHQFWNENKVQTERSFRSQSAARPLYCETVDRKKGLERQESEKGLMVKSGLLKRHQGREKLVHEIVEKKKEEVHEAHKEKIEKTLSKNLQLFDSRIKSVINSIGDEFRKSQEVLQSKQRNLAKKLKDKLIDQEDHRLTVRSNFQQRVKQRSSSLSQCGCRRINNVEQTHLNSNLVKEELRHSYFGDSLKKIERQPSERVKRVNQFITRSQSFKSSVSYNKNLLTQSKLSTDAQRLKREKEIAEALALKKQLQIQGNCYIRKTLVK